MTIERLEAMAKQGGHELKFQDLDELAQIVSKRASGPTDSSSCSGWSQSGTRCVRAHAAALEKGEVPSQHAGILG